MGNKKKLNAMAREIVDSEDFAWFMLGSERHDDYWRTIRQYWLERYCAAGGGYFNKGGDS